MRITNNTNSNEANTEERILNSGEMISYRRTYKYTIYVNNVYKNSKTYMSTSEHPENKYQSLST